MRFPLSSSRRGASVLKKIFRDWDRIKSPAEDQIVPYSKLPEGDVSNLAKLAVLKVNGGLGTSMGAYRLSYRRACA